MKLSPTVTVREVAGGYALSGVTVDGEAAEIVLTDDDILTLSQSIHTYQVGILAEKKRQGQTVPFEIAADVDRLAIGKDPFGDHVRLKIVSNGVELTYELRLLQARNLVETLTAAVAELDQQSLPKQ